MKMQQYEETIRALNTVIPHLKNLSKISTEDKDKDKLLKHASTIYMVVLDIENMKYKNIPSENGLGKETKPTMNGSTKIDTDGTNSERINTGSSYFKEDEKRKLSPNRAPGGTSSHSVINDIFKQNAFREKKFELDKSYNLLRQIDNGGMLTVRGSKIDIGTFFELHLPQNRQILRRNADALNYPAKVKVKNPEKHSRGKYRPIEVDDTTKICLYGRVEPRKGDDLRDMIRETIKKRDFYMVNGLYVGTDGFFYHYSEEYDKFHIAFRNGRFQAYESDEQDMYNEGRSC